MDEIDHGIDGGIESERQTLPTQRSQSKTTRKDGHRRCRAKTESERPKGCTSLLFHEIMRPRIDRWSTGLDAAESSMCASNGGSRKGHCCRK